MKDFLPGAQAGTSALFRAVLDSKVIVRAYQGLAPLAINRGPLRGRGIRVGKASQRSRGNEPLLLTAALFGAGEPALGRPRTVQGQRARLLTAALFGAGESALGKASRHVQGQEPLAINRGPLRGRGIRNGKASRSPGATSPWLLTAARFGAGEPALGRPPPPVQGQRASGY